VNVRTPSPWVRGSLFALCLALPRAAHAEATAEQRAAAQALFDEARRLVADKRYLEACPKLSESQRLDPGLGTLLNLADCQEQTGKTASAWANFLEAAYRAKHDGQGTREATARARAAALEPKLSRLTLLAPSSDLGVEIARDGVVVAPALVGTAVPVDPGPHTVTARAPAKQTWESTIDVPPAGGQRTLTVPALADAAPGEGSGPPAPRVAGIVLTIVGAGGLVAGSVLAARAKQLDDDSLAQGCTGNLCTKGGAQLREHARSYGDGATGAMIAGAVVGAAGVGLLVASVVRERRARARVPAVGAFLDPHGGVRCFAGGTF
jgi:hypothetical protein